MGDLKNRITRARNTFTKLGKIWNNNKITRKTKIKLFKTLVTPVHGERREWQQPTKIDGDVLWRPYVPQGTRRIGKVR